ncbi:hypothetical protein CKF46_37940, partial [Klebsiella pneumoniae]
MLGGNSGFPPRAPAAGLYLRPGDGPDLYRAGVRASCWAETAAFHRARLLLAFIYVQGMALTYTA